MAVDSRDCTIAVATERAKCINCLSKTEKEALRLWLMAQIVARLGGVNYLNINDLMARTACWKCEPDAMLLSFEVAIWKAAAVDLGMTDYTITQLRDRIKCWVCADPKAIRAAYLFLLCDAVGLSEFSERD